MELQGPDDSVIMLNEVKAAASMLLFTALQSAWCDLGWEISKLKSLNYLNLLCINNEQRVGGLDIRSKMSYENEKA